MKKVLLNLVLVFSVFCLLGCGGKKEVDLVKIEKKFVKCFFNIFVLKKKTVYLNCLFIECYLD